MAYGEDMRKCTVDFFADSKEPDAEIRWRLYAPNGRIIADSGEGYLRLKACKNAFDKMCAYLINGHVDKIGLGTSIPSRFP